MKRTSDWTRLFQRNLQSASRTALRAGAVSMKRALRPVLARAEPPPGAGDWLAGVVIGAAGMRRYRLFRPSGVAFLERLPLMVMLHGCQQDARSFAASTRMNALAARERFLVLYPEQDRLANPQGCWNWFETESGKAHVEVDAILRAIDQVCLFNSADRGRVGIAGLSAGASMAALVASRHPDRFQALVMHSGIPPGTAHSPLTALSAMGGRRASRALPERRLPPLLVIHGAADTVVAPSNGRAAARVWSEAAGAEPLAERTVQRGKRHPTRVTEFKRAGEAVATLVEVDRLAHAWSGGAAREPFSDAKGPDASRMAWSFVSRRFAR